jgi:hypothetical protein
MSMCPVFIGSVALGRAGGLYRNVLSMTNLIIAVLGTEVARWIAFGRLLPYWRPRGRDFCMPLRRLGARREVALRFAIVLLVIPSTTLFPYMRPTVFTLVKMLSHIFGLEFSRDISPAKSAVCLRES